MLGRKATATFGTLVCRTDTKSPSPLGSSTWLLPLYVNGCATDFIPPSVVGITAWRNAVLSEEEIVGTLLSEWPPERVLLTPTLRLWVSLCVIEPEIEGGTLWMSVSSLFEIFAPFLLVESASFGWLFLRCKISSNYSKTIYQFWTLYFIHNLLCIVLKLILLFNFHLLKCGLCKNLETKVLHIYSFLTFSKRSDTSICRQPSVKKVLDTYLIDLSIEVGRIQDSISFCQIFQK